VDSISLSEILFRIDFYIESILYIDLVVLKKFGYVNILTSNRLIIIHGDWTGIIDEDNATFYKNSHLIARFFFCKNQGHSSYSPRSMSPQFQSCTLAVLGCKCGREWRVRCRPQSVSRLYYHFLVNITINLSLTTLTTSKSRLSNPRKPES